MRVFGARLLDLCCIVAPGSGCVMREWSDEVRFGITTLSSSRLTGRPDSMERGREVNEGAMRAVLPDGRCGVYCNATMQVGRSGDGRKGLLVCARSLAPLHVAGTVRLRTGRTVCGRTGVAVIYSSRRAMNRMIDGRLDDGQLSCREIGGERETTVRKRLR